MNKTCRKCEQELPVLRFDKAPRGLHGRRSTCRACRAGLVKSGPAPKFTRKLAGTRYLITSAQNATPVDGPFFDALKVAAAHLGAELVVIPLRYKNPTSVWSKNQDTTEWWGVSPADEAAGVANPLAPYLFNGRKKLGPRLVLVGDVKIQPTASSPLTGFESLTGAESCVIGHPKMQLRSVAAPPGRDPKILSTTGAVTRRNFTDSKAGKLGAFHHCLGAVLVELRGSKFWIRQINADRKTGSFIDLDKIYSPAGVRKAPPALGLIMGDTHARFADPAVDRATHGPGGIVGALNPRVLVWHDTLDGYTINPHHAGNPFIAAAKYQSKFGTVRDEVEHAVRFVVDRSRGRESVIVGSNHDNFLTRWITSADWKQNPANARFYLETALVMLDSAKLGPEGAEYTDPFVHWVNALKGTAAIRCLKPSESFLLADVECGNHGHLGPNGARGSIKNLSNLGAKMVSGHGHSFGIEGGHYRVGTSTPLSLEYTAGPSSWGHAQCVVYANGKRSLLMINEGEWRAP